MTKQDATNPPPATPGDDARLARERDIRLARERRDEYLRLAKIWDTTLAQLSGEPGAPKTKPKVQELVIEYLVEIDHAVDRGELVKALLARGVASDKDRPTFVINESIRYNTSDRRVKEHKLKIVSGKVGLKEWPPAKFK